MPSKRLASVALGLALAGCAGNHPWFGPQGTIEQQRLRATVNDPYSDQDAGPEVVGGRPRDYQQPLPEPVRSRIFADSGGKLMNTTSKLLWVGLAGVLVVAAALAGRWALGNWTRERLAQTYLRQIAELPEPAAATRVRQLADAGEEALPALARALDDNRDTVAEAAERSLADMVSSWQSLPADESSHLVAALARELALVAPHLPPARRRGAQQLAERLLVWRIDPSAANVAQLLADCETVLRLPVPDTSDVRLASAEARELLSVEPSASADIAPAPVELPLPTPLPFQEPAEPTPVAPRRLADPGEPELLPHVTSEQPLEPRQFLPPRAVQLPQER